MKYQDLPNDRALIIDPKSKFPMFIRPNRLRWMMDLIDPDNKGKWKEQLEATLNPPSHKEGK